MDYNISIMCLPPHCSHALQPLDVSVFRAFKKKLSEVFQNWFKMSKCKSVSKAVFPSLLKQAWDHLDATHVVNGFRRTGLYPINKQAVDDKIVGNPAEVVNHPSKKKDPTSRMIRAVSSILKPEVTPEMEAA